MRKLITEEHIGESLTNPQIIGLWYYQEKQWGSSSLRSNYKDVVLFDKNKLKTIEDHKPKRIDTQYFIKINRKEKSKIYSKRQSY